MNVPGVYESAKNKAFLSLRNRQVPPSAARPSSPIRNNVYKSKISDPFLCINCNISIFWHHILGSVHVAKILKISLKFPLRFQKFTLHTSNRSFAIQYQKELPLFRCNFLKVQNFHFLYLPQKIYSNTFFNSKTL